MSVHHNCPRCRLEIAEERLRVVPFVCDHCGFTLSRPNSAPHQIDAHEKSDLRLMMWIAAALVMGFIAASSNVELRWLQARDSVGFSSLKSLERLAEICSNLHKHSCVDHALARQVKLDPKRSARHAGYLIGRSKFKEAVQTMRKYIASGKADANSHALYGQALAETGQIEEAAKHYEKALSARAPSMGHVQTYVKYLTRAKRFDQALSVILRTRRKHPYALPVEYRVISELRGAVNNRVMASKR